MKQLSRLALFIVIAGFSLSPALAQNAPTSRRLRRRRRLRPP
ncbi:MAG TPA: hypothetical protein VKA03_02685 [Methylovirgula sp.]|nr:hypothetical protein [Methylovirgula sp.]